MFGWGSFEGVRVYFGVVWSRPCRELRACPGACAHCAGLLVRPVSARGRVSVTALENKVITKTSLILRHGNVASPRGTSQLRRYLADYCFATIGCGPTAALPVTILPLTRNKLAQAQGRNHSERCGVDCGWIPESAHSTLVSGGSNTGSLDASRDWFGFYRNTIEMEDLGFIVRHGAMSRSLFICCHLD